ncbi:50S ribosomal protein L17 [Patescibacteria group bacterium]|nr:MAG: 50S ribosomal protein L17 [Patescibacteria group bacterium]
MHRHGYKGRKLQRAAGPRRALVRGQITSLVLHEQITTTVAKAKEIAPQFEKLVTKAKKGDLHNRRLIRAVLLTDKATTKLVEEIAPAFKNREGGYTRIVKLGNRLGDNAPMAAVMLTDKPQRVAEKPKAKPATKKPAAKKAEADSAKAKKPAAKKAPAKKEAAK